MGNKLYMPKSGLNPGMFYVGVMAVHIVHNGIGYRRMFICYWHTEGGSFKIEEGKIRPV